MAEGADVVERGRKWITDHPASIVSVAGLLLFGILRLNYEVFYSRLGVAPEEVGLSYANTVGQSALGLVLGVLFGAALTSAWLGVTIPNEYVGRFVGHAARERLGSFARAIIIGGSFLAAAWLLGQSLSSANVIHLLGSLFCLTVATTALMPDAFPRLFPGGRESAAAHASRVGRIVMVGGLAFGLLWAVLLLPVEVAADADVVEKGREVSAYSLPGLEVGVLSYRAVATRVQLTGALAESECLLYLGRADGVSVFFDDDPRGVVRIPTDDVVAREANAGTLSECEASNP